MTIFEQLKPNPDNPRTITKEEFTSLKRSILTFSKMLTVRPIVYDEKFIVLGGNMRLLALQSLIKEGFEVKDEYFISAKGWTEDEKKEFVVKDNLLFGKWDWDEIANKWDEEKVKDWGLVTQPWVPENNRTNPVVEMVKIDYVKPHPRKYREHPPEQIDALVDSIKQNGIYRNLIIAKDGTILDGHALVEACKKLNIKTIPVMRLNIEPESEQALKILASNNEMGRFAMTNDRILTDMLKEIKETSPDGLKGTGFDDMKLANLAMVSRPAGEIADMNEAAEWVGMPEFEKYKDIHKLHISFEDEGSRAEFMKAIKATVINKAFGKIWCIWWPEKARDDLKSIKFE